MGPNDFRPKNIRKATRAEYDKITQADRDLAAHGGKAAQDRIAAHEAEQSRIAKEADDKAKAGIEIAVREMLASDSSTWAFSPLERTHVINRVLNQRADVIKKNFRAAPRFGTTKHGQVVKLDEEIFDLRLAFLQAIYAVKEKRAKANGEAPPLANAPSRLGYADQWTEEAGRERQKQKQILEDQIQNGLTYTDEHGVQRRLRISDPRTIMSGMPGGNPGSGIGR